MGKGDVGIKKNARSSYKSACLVKEGDYLPASKNKDWKIKSGE